ncbi:MAG: cation-translocating P-type ATPase [Acetobacteraceae bacterium]|nr:cation-translocating P-type ATPase [Acetobacteraceae bacterium]
MSASTLESPVSAGLGGLLDRSEKLLLGLRLTLAMVAAGLLAVALGWEWAFPEDATLANLVAAAAAALVAFPVMAAAWHSLRHPSLHGVTDRLIAVALVAAWTSGDLMTAAILPIVIIGGHVLEERSLLGSREAIRALGRLTETSVRRLRADGGVEVVASRALRPGDRIELLPGDRAPADGMVVAGAASLDMASLTGESVPVEVAAGQLLLAGSINTNGRIEALVDAVGESTTLGKIIGLMRTAERAKPPVARLLERYAGQYMAAVLMVAAGTWFASGDLAATLAVLVASCPCALVLAAPATSVAAIAVAARHGILIKGAAFIEHLAEASSVVFDKTGTLTLGELALVRVVTPDPADAAEALLVAGTLGAGSNHPVSRAAVRAGPGASPGLEDFREVGGFGLTGTLAGEAVAFGRPDLLAQHGIDAVSALPAHDGPIAAVARGGRLLGWLLFADQPRPEAMAALADLRGLGLTHQMLLTGDRLAVARRIAAQLGIASVAAEALPEEKMRRVMAEVAGGHTPIVVGDGINDSLALKAGAIGVAMGARGTDVALASADLVLMTSDLGRLGTAIRLSRRCRRTIHVNVAMGLIWTLGLVGLAASGMLGAAGAVIAALLHNVSTFAGLGNAGRLLSFDEVTPDSVRKTSSVVS